MNDNELRDLIINRLGFLKKTTAVATGLTLVFVFVFFSPINFKCFIHVVYICI